jgi:hypothetical protein
MRRDGSGESMTLPDNVGRTQLLTIINEWVIGRNAERDRAILCRRLFDGITFERLAEEFDLSPRQTREIVHKCEHKIFRHFPG